MAVATDGTYRGVPGPARPAGFTLIEILVILVVLGVAAGVLVLQLGHDRTATLRLEAERLRTSLEYGAQLAQWRHEPLVWEADGEGYRFLRPDDKGDWREESEPELARHPLPDAIRVRIAGPAGVPVAPRVAFRASGRNDPYTITLEGDAGTWTLRADPLNRVLAAPGR